MELNEILLVCAALIPAIALCIYVYKKDRVEKEPIGLLLGLLVLGALSCYPAAELEGVVGGWIRDIFVPYGRVENGVLHLSSTMFKIYSAVRYFLCVGLIEEGIKFLILYMVTKDNKNFNCLFDGMIYAIFVSLGFAALENVFYVLRYGWQTAIARAYLSVPGHMFFAVLMGYYYSRWHMYKLAKKQELQLKQLGLIPLDAKEFSGVGSIIMALLLPIAVHGFYDFCCTWDSLVMNIVFAVFMGILYVQCFSKISEMSKCDMKDSTASSVLVLTKYPHLMETTEKEDDTENQSAANEI